MENPRKLLEQLERSLLTPGSRNDTALLGKLLADDFVEIGASGQTHTKDAILALLSVEISVSIIADNLSVSLLSPDVGLVTYTAVKTHAGTTTLSKRCSVWRNNRGHWQMVYHQGTVADAAT